MGRKVASSIAVLACAGLSTGCTDWGRVCSIHIKVLAASGQPMPNVGIEIAPTWRKGTATIRPRGRFDRPPYQLITDATGAAHFEYLQEWSGRGVVRVVRWTHSLGSTELVVDENAHVFYVFRETEAALDVRKVSQAAFEG